MPFNKPTIRYRYPHLLNSDNAIWSRFLKKYPDYFDLVDYDIHVGKGIALDPTWDPQIQKDATMLTQRRIDVVAIKGKVYYIIEIKQYPGAACVGQLITYRILYKQKYPDRPTPRLILVANKVDRDLITTLEELHISHFEV